MGLTPPSSSSHGHKRPGPPADRLGLAVLGIAVLSVLYCGLPLLAAALVTTGAAGWLLIHGSLLAVPVTGAAASLLWWRWRRTQC